MVDYLPISDVFILFEPSIGSEEFPRRQCITTQFFRDNTYENTESFTLDLRLDSLTTDVLIDPDMTEVFLLDVDGKKSHCIYCDHLQLTLYFDTDLVLGFIGLPFQANENDGFVAVEFGIQSGSLQTEVSIELFFSDLVALSKLYAQDYISIYDSY